MEEVNAGRTLWRYRRRFRVDGLEFLVTIRSRTDGNASELTLLGVPVAQDRTPAFGPESVRNHRLETRLPDGRAMAVEAGYVSVWNTGIAVRIDGELVHESHPGRTIAYPEKYLEIAAGSKGRTVGEALREGFHAGSDSQGLQAGGHDLGQLKRNKVPILVDISLGILFFVVAKLTDLSTAAIFGAGVGIALVVAQRFVKVDLLGGLALFGIVMLLLSAALAIALQDDMAVKMRSTILGLVSAGLFLGDGLLGGNRLGRGMSRYLPYSDIDPGRLALGLGLIGLVMAGLNYVVAILTSTDFWLFYTTFVDFFLVMLMILFVFRFARGKLFPRGYRPRGAS